MGYYYRHHTLICVSETKASIPGTSCFLSPAVRKEKVLAQGRKDSHDGREDITHWWQRWEHPLVVCGPLRNAASSVQSVKAQQSWQEVATATTERHNRLSRERTPRVFAYSPSLVLARANRHSSGKNRTWTHDPLNHVAVISKSSHTKR